MDTTMRLLRTYAVSRRHFLKATTIAGSVAALQALDAQTRAGVALAHVAAQDGGDVGLGNFVLRLERLQNALYGTLIDAAILSAGAAGYAQEFQTHQDQHVRDLTTVLQDTLGSVPENAPPSYNFPAFTTEAEALATVADVESLGAAAYLGAAPLIQDQTFLNQALAIHPVEAEHAAAFRLLAGRDPLTDAFAPEQNQEDVVQAIQQFLATAALPDTGVMDTGWTFVGVAGSIAATAAGLALARNSRPHVSEHE